MAQEPTSGIGGDRVGVAAGNGGNDAQQRGGDPGGGDGHTLRRGHGGTRGVAAQQCRAPAWHHDASRGERHSLAEIHAMRDVCESCETSAMAPGFTHNWCGEPRDALPFSLQSPRAPPRDSRRMNEFHLMDELTLSIVAGMNLGRSAPLF